MTMLLLKRLNVALDRDVIFRLGVRRRRQLGHRHRLSWCASTSRRSTPNTASPRAAASTRIGGEVKFATVQTLEKIPRGIELVAHGISGHGSVPLKSNAIVHLAGAVAKVGDWRPDIRFNETTGTYFRRLAAISPPEVAKYYRDVLLDRSEGARRPPTTGCSRTSRAIPRCCARRCRRTSSQAAIART